MSATHAPEINLVPDNIFHEAAWDSTVSSARNEATQSSEVDVIAGVALMGKSDGSFMQNLRM